MPPSPAGADPAVRVRDQQLTSWVGLWARLPAAKRRIVEAAWNRLRGTLQERATRWSSAKGPLSATLATLLDLRCKPESPGLLVDDSQTEWVLDDTLALGQLQDAIVASVTRNLWARAVEAWTLGDTPHLPPVDEHPKE
jgi:hypothetical protein